MKLPVDTSAIAFLCALAPEPVVDFETRRPKADENGEPLYLIQLLAMGDGSADLLAVKAPGVPSSAIRQGAPSRSPGWSPSPGPRRADEGRDAVATDERRGRHGCRELAGPCHPSGSGARNTRSQLHQE